MTYPIQRVGDPNRKASRYIKREYKAQQYRFQALQGGGEREVARRRKQFEKIMAWWDNLENHYEKVLP